MKLTCHLDVKTEISTLLGACPRAWCLRLAEARNAAGQRAFERARELFSRLLDEEPARVLEIAQPYGDALFVLGRKAELSCLVSKCAQWDRLHPATSCVLGNLWSLEGQHERAAIAFRRALKLDPHQGALWILVGHEQVELRNPSAAIACYQRATQESPWDARGWFGLGQVYDLLGASAQAAEYYRRAADAAPRDPRMWMALGRLFAGEGMLEHALEAYGNALAVTGENGGRLLRARLAHLHHRLGRQADALEHALEFLGGIASPLGQIEGSEEATAILLVAQHHLRGGDVEEEGKGQALLFHLATTYSGPEGQQAKRLLSLHEGGPEEQF